MQGKKRHDICQKIYTAGFSGQEFYYTGKMRNDDLRAKINKYQYFGQFLVRHELVQQF